MTFAYRVMPSSSSSHLNGITAVVTVVAATSAVIFLGLVVAILIISVANKL